MIVLLWALKNSIRLYIRAWAGIAEPCVSFRERERHTELNSIREKGRERPAHCVYQRERPAHCVSIRERDQHTVSIRERDQHTVSIRERDQHC